MPQVLALRPFVIEGVTYAKDVVITFNDAGVSDHLVGRKDVTANAALVAAAIAGGATQKTHTPVVRKITPGDSPVMDRTSGSAVPVDPLTLTPVGGSGGRWGVRKMALSRALHYAQNDAIDPLAHDILRVPADWTNTTRFSLGSTCKNPSYPGYYFMFRGVRPSGTSGEPTVSASGGYTTAAAPVPNTDNPYAFVADAATGATWYQYPAGDFPVTKKWSLMNAAGSAPIVPITSTANVSFSSLAGVTMVDRWRDSYLRKDGTPNLTVWANNFDATFARIYDPFRKSGRNDYGYGDMLFSFNGSGVAQTGGLGRNEYTFDVNCSTLGLEFGTQRSSSGAQAGDILPMMKVFVDGVAIDWCMLQFGGYTGSGGYVPKLVLPFRDNRRRRVKIAMCEPTGTTAFLRGISCSADGTILPLPFTPIPWYFSADSTGAGASSGPQDGLNVGKAIGWTVGFGGGVDISRSGTGHLHPVDAPGSTFNHITTFVQNANLGILDATVGGENFLMHVIYVEGWDEITTNALFTPEYRRQKYTDFLNRWKAAQPNCVLVLVAKRIENEWREMNQIQVASTAGISVGDTIGNSASSPTTQAVVRGINTSARLLFIEYVGQVLNDNTGNVTGALASTYSLPAFAGGENIYKGASLVTNVTQSIANRLSAVDSTGNPVPLPAVTRSNEALIWADWLAAIAAAGLDSDQYMFVTLAEEQLASDFKNSWRWYSRIYQDQNQQNLLQSYDLVHPSQQYHAYVGRYIGQQIRRALTVGL